MFYELYENFDKELLTGNQQEGIIIYIYDQLNRVLDTIVVQQETHKSYQKNIVESGTHRICLRGTKKLFSRNANVKYEMSIQIEALHEHYENDPSKNAGPSRLLMKEHIDKVDEALSNLYQRAETIIQDQDF